MVPSRDSPLTRRVGRSGPADYFTATRQPLHCLVFLLPLLIACEIAAVLVSGTAWPDSRLVAPRLLQRLVAWLGTDAAWVPGAVLLLTLLVWQVLSGHPWRVRAGVPLLMIPESLLLALPLLVLNQLLQQTAAGSADPQSAALPAHILVALGAGLYEELVFRFYLITGLAWLLARLARLPRRSALGVAAALAALLFAACHFRPVGVEPFRGARLVLLTVAGGYLGLVFVTRGLGIATGCHVAHNLIALLLAHQRAT